MRYLRTKGKIDVADQKIGVLKIPEQGKICRDTKGQEELFGNFGIIFI